MKFAIKAIWQYPPYLRHVATLPWKMKHSHFLQIWKKKQTNWILIASNWLHIIFFLSLFFYLLTFMINLCHRKYVTETSLQCLSTINTVFSDEDRNLIKSLYLKGYTTKRFIDEFPEKSWTKRMELTSSTRWRCNQPALFRATKR